MRRSVLVLIALASSACAADPPPTLEEKLAGKSPEERREVLRVACLNEAERLGDESKEVRTTHGVKADQATALTRRLKAICREMTDAYPATRHPNRGDRHEACIAADTRVPARLRSRTSSIGRWMG